MKVLNTPSVQEKDLVSKGSSLAIFNWAAFVFVGFVAFAADVINLVSYWSSSQGDESGCTHFSLARWNDRYNGLTDAEAKRTFRDQDRGRRICGIFLVANVSSRSSRLIISLVDPSMDSDEVFLEVEFDDNKGHSLRIGDTISFYGDLVEIQKFSPGRPRELRTLFIVQGFEFDRTIGVPPNTKG